jgi:hypothetical protein
MDAFFKFLVEKAALLKLLIIFAIFLFTTCYPPFTQTYYVRSFRILNSEETLGNDEPYIWVWGLRVDANSYVAADYVESTVDYIFPNIVENPVVNKWYRISPRVGRISFPVVMVRGNALSGVLCIVWEKDDTPTEKVVEAYKAVSAQLQEFVARRINQAKFSDLSKEERIQLKREIEQAIRDVFVEAVNWYNPLTWNVDDYIGTIELIQFHEDYPKENIYQIFDLKYKGQFGEAHYQIEVQYDK